MLTARHADDLDTVVEAINAQGGAAIGVVADSADPNAPKEVFSKASEAFGQVDIMVNNAGYGDMCSIEETSDEHFDMVVQINFAGVFRCPDGGGVGGRRTAGGDTMLTYSNGAPGASLPAAC